MHYNEVVPRGESNRRLTTAQVDEIVRRYTTRHADGTWEGTVLLAREFGVQAPTVRRWLCVRGVILRSSKEAAAGGKRCKPVRNLPGGTIPAVHGPYPVHMALPGAPACKCGCGDPVTWNRRKNKWSAYATGHYRRPESYKDAAWLRAEYIGKQRTLEEIAAEQGVSRQAIKHFMTRYEIAVRDGSAAHIGRQAGPANPAWRGGVADWPYSSDWKVLARQIRYRDEWTCQDCGEQREYWGVSLHVHHIDWDKMNNDPANLISLCAKCHVDRHRRECRSRIKPAQASAVS